MATIDETKNTLQEIVYAKITNDAELLRRALMKEILCNNCYTNHTLNDCSVDSRPEFRCPECSALIVKFE